MKVNELMIGDLVNVNGLNLKVGAIHADEIGVFDPDFKIYWCSDDGLDRIDPIPLTEEILVNNGFEDVTEEGDRIRLLGTFDENDNITFVNLYPATIGYGTDVPQLKVYYVHQLQHLLRLCGIEKELVIV